MASNGADVSGLSSDVLTQLNNAESRSLLDTVDKLRELQVGQIINLPQIIVVGDQSSGKSSVLEAISRVRFPVDEDVCTRFATELVLRRANETKVDVSIRYAADASTSSGHADNPPQPFRRSGFDSESLADIIKEAKERMGIQKSGFSKDTLRVEVSGPDVPPLTLVDLPGLFHSATADQSQEGKEIVDQLIESYMKQEKSIILAVVAANYNLANHTVAEQAKRHDPTRQRTLGVITKPDLAGSGSNRRKYIDLANGLEAEHKLTLGWFVLRNRSDEEKDLSFDERDLNEKRFFESGDWAAIRHKNRGAKNLRERLSKVLLEHIKTSLPSVIHEIDYNLRQRNEELKRLGKQRSSPEDQRLYLLDIAEFFQRLARDGIEGRYNHNFFGDLDQTARKLRALLRKLNRAFSATLSAKGRTYEIERSDTKEDSDDGKDDKPPKYLLPFIDHYKDFPDPEPITQLVLNSKVELLAANNQGKEFPGTPNSDLALQLFKMQAEPWKDIAKFHIDLALNYSKAFVEDTFAYVIGADKPTEAAVLRDLVDPFFDNRRVVLETKLEELLRPYTDGFGLPLETEFHQTLSKSTLQRLVDQLCVTLKDKHPETLGNTQQGGLLREQIQRALSDKDNFQNSEFGTEKVIDMMVGYYEMSRRTFTENVVNLAVESCLICNIPDILTPRMVYEMSEDQLAGLAAESSDVREERQILKAQVKILEEGLKKCRSNAPRKATAAPLVAIRPPRETSPAPAPEASATKHSSGLTNGAPQTTTSTPTKLPPTAAQHINAQVADHNSPASRLFGGPPAPTPASGTPTSGQNPPAGSILFASSAGTTPNNTSTNSGGLFPQATGSSLFPARPSGSGSSNAFGSGSTTQTAGPSNAGSLFQTANSSVFRSGSPFGTGSSSNANSGFGTSNSSKLS